MVSSRRTINIALIKNKKLKNSPKKQIKKKLIKISSRKSSTSYKTSKKTFKPRKTNKSLSSTLKRTFVPRKTNKSLSSTLKRTFNPRKTTKSVSSVHRKYFHPKKPKSSSNFSTSSNYYSGTSDSTSSRNYLRTSRPSFTPMTVQRVNPTFVPKRKQTKKYSSSGSVFLTRVNPTFVPKRKQTKKHRNFTSSSKSYMTHIPKKKQKNSSVFLTRVNPTFVPKRKQRTKILSEKIESSIFTGTKSEQVIMRYYKNNIKELFTKYQHNKSIKYITFYLLHNAVKIVIDNNISYVIKDKLSTFKESFLYEMIIYFVLITLEKTSIQISIKTYKKLQDSVMNRIVVNIKSVNQRFINYEILTHRSELVHRQGSSLSNRGSSKRGSSRKRSSRKRSSRKRSSRKRRSVHGSRKAHLSKRFDELFKDGSSRKRSLRKRISRKRSYKI